jgi:TatD DNase family protein
MLINIHTHFSTGRTIEVVSRTFDEELNGIYSFGIHPWQSETYQQLVNKVNLQIKDKYCIAIGEIGLDKLKGPDLEIQKSVFIHQLKIAEENNLPVILHCVRSWNELKLIKRNCQPKQPWIFHGFTKSSILKEVLNEQIMVSIGAAILNNSTLQKSLNTIPNDQLFLETDESEVPISTIYEKVSELKNIPLQQLVELIENNFKRVFTKWTTGLNVQNF